MTVHKSYAKLNPQIKRQIVVRLAGGQSPSEIVRWLKAEHGLQFSTAAVAKYDPRVAAGAKLSAELRNLFEQTYRDALNEISYTALAHRALRVAYLSRVVDDARERNDFKSVLYAISLIQKDTADLDWTPADGDNDENW